MKVLKKIDRIHRHTHIGLAGKLLPNPASRFCGRAASQRISLDDDHLATATLSQVIGDATTNDATSNNQNVRRSGKCLSLFTHSCISTTSCFLLSPQDIRKVDAHPLSEFMSLIILATSSIEAKAGKNKKKKPAFSDPDQKKKGKNGL